MMVETHVSFIAVAVGIVLLLGLLVVGVLSLWGIVNLVRSRRWAALVLVALLMLGVGLLAGFAVLLPAYTYRQLEHPVEQQFTVPQPPRPPAAGSSHDEVYQPYESATTAVDGASSDGVSWRRVEPGQHNTWIQEATEIYEADVYPSTAEAARGLGHRIVPLIEKILNNEQATPPVHESTNEPSEVAEVPPSDTSSDASTDTSEEHAADVTTVDDSHADARDEFAAASAAPPAATTAPAHASGPSLVQVAGPTIELDRPGDGRIAAEVARVIRERWPAATVLTESTTVERDVTQLQDPRAVAVRIGRVLSGTRSRPWGSDERTGVLTASVRSARASIETSTQFVDKPWVANPAQFTSEHSDFRCSMAYSDEFTETIEQAREAAENHAADILYRKVNAAAMNLVAARGMTTTITTAATYRAARDNLDDLTRDHFSQMLGTVNGHLYRHAMLLDTSDAAIQPVADRLLRAESRTARSVALKQRSTALMLIMLAVCVTGIVWLLNTVSRGYYTRQTLIAGVVIGAAALGIALLFMA